MEVKKEVLERASKHISGLFTEFDPKCDVYRKANKKWQDMWANKHVFKMINDISNITTGETHKNCEVWIPRIWGNIFPYRMFFDFDSKSDKKELVKKFYRKILDAMDYEKKHIPGIRNFTIEGMEWYKVYLDMTKTERVVYSYEEVQDISDNPLVEMVHKATEQLTGKPVMKTVRKEKYYHKPFDAANIREVPSERMIYDTEIDKLEDMSWVMEKVEIRPSTLRNKEKADGGGIYINIDLVEEKILAQMTPEDKDLNKPIDCVEYQGLFDIHDDGDPVQCIMVKPIDFDFVVRCEENTYKFKKPTYVVDRFLTVKGRFPGMGIPELCVKVQEEIDSKRNLISAGESMVLFDETIIGANVRVDKEDLKPRPGNIIRLKGGSPNDIQPRKRNLQINGALALEQIAKQDFREMAKVSATQMGAVKGGETTAYEVASATRESNLSIKFVIESYTANVVEPSLSMIQDIFEQFSDDNEVYDIDGEMVRAIDIKKIGKMKVLGVANLEHEALNFKSAVDIYMAVMKSPVVQDSTGQTYPVNQKKALEDLLKAYKKEDIHEYVGTSPMQAPMAEQGGGQSPTGGKGILSGITNAIGSMFKSKKV